MVERNLHYLQDSKDVKIIAGKHTSKFKVQKVLK